VCVVSTGGWCTIPCFSCCDLSGDCQVMQMPEGLVLDITICGYESVPQFSAIKNTSFQLPLFSFCTFDQSKRLGSGHKL
jgi:hypothetical protein